MSASHGPHAGTLRVVARAPGCRRSRAASPLTTDAARCSSAWAPADAAGGVPRPKAARRVSAANFSAAGSCVASFVASCVFSLHLTAWRAPCPSGASARLALARRVSCANPFLDERKNVRDRDFRRCRVATSLVFDDTFLQSALADRHPVRECRSAPDQQTSRQGARPGRRAGHRCPASASSSCRPVGAFAVHPSLRS